MFSLPYLGDFAFEVCFVMRSTFFQAALLETQRFKAKPDGAVDGSECAESQLSPLVYDPSVVIFVCLPFL